MLKFTCFCEARLAKRKACPEDVRTAFLFLEEVASIAWIVPFGILQKIVTNGQT